jgi:hypothetical protein
MGRVSLVWAYGINGMLEHYSRDEVIIEIMHTLPDGRRVEKPVMTIEEAEEVFRTGNFPERFIAQVNYETH